MSAHKPMKWIPDTSVNKDKTVAEIIAESQGPQKRVSLGAISVLLILAIIIVAGVMSGYLS